MKKLSKYQRKNMTPEAITEYEKDVDADGYELIKTDGYGGYTIETRKGVDDSGAVEWKVWNDFDDHEDFAENEKQVDNIIQDLRDEIDEEIAYFDEEDDY